MTDILRLFTSPVTFFRGVANIDIAWPRAILPVALYVAGVSLSSSIIVARQSEWSLVVVNILLSVVSTFIGLLVVFWCYAGIVITCDLLFAVSRKYRKLIECVALAHWPVAVWSCLVALTVAGWFGFGDLPQDVTGSQAFLIVQGIGLTISMCVCALCGVAVRAVSGVPVVVAVLMVMFLSSVFVLVPWVVGFF